MLAQTGVPVRVCGYRPLYHMADRYAAQGTPDGCRYALGPNAALFSSGFLPVFAILPVLPPSPVPRRHSRLYYQYRLSPVRFAGAKC